MPSRRRSLEDGGQGGDLERRFGEMMSECWGIDLVKGMFWYRGRVGRLAFGLGCLIYTALEWRMRMCTYITL